MTSTAPVLGELVTHRRTFDQGCELVCDVSSGGEGLPVVVLTGATGTRQISAMMMAPLIGKRPLVMPDPRGHGGGVCRHPEHYSWRQLIDDVYDWLEELAITRCSLVGTSLGAIVAMGIVVERPDLVSALALTSPAIVAVDVPEQAEQDAAIQRLTAAFGNQGSPDPEHTASEFSALSGMPLDQAKQRLALHRDLDSVACYFRSARREDIPFTSADLQTIAAPTLVLPGADVVHASAVGLHIANLIPTAELPDLSTVTEGISDPTEFRVAVFAEVCRWLLAQP